MKDVEFLKEILDKRYKLYQANHFGPFRLVCNPNLKDFLEGWYGPIFAPHRITIAERVLRIDGIKEIVFESYEPTFNVEKL